jgi:hypothetical protein
MIRMNSSSTASRIPIATHLRTGPSPFIDRIPSSRMTVPSAPNSSAAWIQFMYSSVIGELSASAEVGSREWGVGSENMSMMSVMSLLPTPYSSLPTAFDAPHQNSKTCSRLFPASTATTFSPRPTATPHG